MQRRGIAVIGAGMGMKPHALSLCDLADRAEVIGVFSRSAERREAAHAAYGFPVSDDLDALVADPQVDVVLVLTPPSAHLEIVRLAAAAGKSMRAKALTAGGPAKLVCGRARARRVGAAPNTGASCRPLHRLRRSPSPVSRWRTTESAVPSLRSAMTWP